MLEQLKQNATPIFGGLTLATAAVLWTEVVTFAHNDIPHDEYVLVASFDDYNLKQERRWLMQEIAELKAELRELIRELARAEPGSVDYQLLEKDIEVVEQAIDRLEVELEQL